MAGTDIEESRPRPQNATCPECDLSESLYAHTVADNRDDSPDDTHSLDGIDVLHMYVRAPYALM